MSEIDYEIGSITSLLEYFGKELENQDAVDFIKTFQHAYIIQPSNLCNQILAYLANKHIKSNKISLKILEEFKQNYIKSEYQNEDEPIIKFNSKPKQQPKPKLLESDFMEDYVADNKENIINEETNLEVQSKKKPKIAFNYHINDNDGECVCMFINEYTVNKKSRKVCQENLIKKFNLLVNEGFIKDVCDFSELISVGWFSKDDIYMYGKICMSYNHEGEDWSTVKIRKLTTDNIRLECVNENDFSRISLNLEKLHSYSFYPGQNVILKGCTISKTDFVVQEVLPNLINPIEPIQMIDEICNDLKLLIASNLSYNKQSYGFISLKLIEIAANSNCDAVLLCGPFMMNDLSLLMKSDVGIFDSVINQIYQCANKFKVHVFLVPNTRDATCFNVFPQSPFSIPIDLVDETEYVHLCKNPEMITLQQYTFGVCSEDILSEFSQLELSKNCPGRLNRFCRHILSDSTLCPLFTDNFNIEPNMFYSEAQIQTTPHCLIVPSKINNFHEMVDHTLCINPGQVVKDDQVTLGTYCIMEIDGSKISQPSKGIQGATRINFHTLKLA